MTTNRVAALPCWKQEVSCETLEGGITNRNYLVHDGAERFVARICEDRSFLGIDRRNERLCQEAACRAGIAPRVHFFGQDVLVSEYLESRTLTAEDASAPAMMTRIGSAVRQLHDARQSLTGELLFFCPFQTVRTYVETARKLSASMPDGIDTQLNTAAQLAAEIAPYRPTLCHNDLLPANVLEQGERLWIVDWEYAGVGNPLFDLASVSANFGLSGELDRQLLEAYGIESTPSVLSEIRILKTVSLLREALWAVIQTVKSDLDFDFADYAETNLAAYHQQLREL